MITKECYLVNEILPLINDDAENKAELDGDLIKLSSIRLQTFKKNIKCVSCGITGTFFRKEKSHVNDKSFHLNLYAIEDGKDVLMTHDHIYPKSKGGPDHIFNSQTMCYKCNQEKDNKIDVIPENIIIRRIEDGK